jgi:regulator of replication initiation timing
LNQKLIQTRKELNDLKMGYTMKCKENETLAKENQELKDTLSSKNAYSSKDNTEVKKLMEEIQKLRSLNKHRDEILNQIET